MTFENALKAIRNTETEIKAKLSRKLTSTTSTTNNTSEEEYSVKKIYRSNWNGKDQYVFLISGETLRESIYNNYGDSDLADFPEVNDVFAIKTAQNTITVGWVPSQTDMLSNDWYIVGEETEEEETLTEDINKIENSIKEINTEVVIPKEEIK